MKRTWDSLLYRLVFSLLILFSSLVISKPHETKAIGESWLTGWSYRKSIITTGSASGAVDDYQMPVNVYSGYLGALPSVVAKPSGSDWANVGSPSQRYTFYAKGRFWLFYSNGTDGEFTSSLDGITWTANTTFAAGLNTAYMFSVVLDDLGDYVHVSYGTTAQNNPLYYKRGLLVANGTISFDSPQTVKASDVNVAYVDSTIILDSIGYPWVAWASKNTATTTGIGYAVKSSTNNGTWTEEFTQQINDTVWAGVAAPHGTLVKMSNGKVYAAASAYGNVAEGRLYNGSSWGSVEQINGTIQGEATLGLVADSSDTVFISYMPNHLGVRTISGVWTEESLGSLGDGQLIPGIYNDDVYVFGLRHEGLDYEVTYIRRSSAGLLDAVRVLSIFSEPYFEEGRLSVSIVPYNGSFIFTSTNNATFQQSATVTLLPVNDMVSLLSTSGYASVILKNKGAANFSDIRFTDSDGNTLLSYYIGKEKDDSYAKAWVKLSSVPASPSTSSFYVYYGNSGVATSSSGSNTFITYDDFERGVNGDAVGGSWTLTTANSTISTEQKDTGTRSMKLIGGTSTQISIPVTASANISILYSSYKEIDASFYFYHGDAGDNAWVQTNSLADIQYYDSSFHAAGKTRPNTWDAFEYNKFNYTTDKFDIIHNFINIKTEADGRPAVGIVDQVVFAGSSVVGDDAWIDNFIVRNFISPEPVWSSIGAEEGVAELTTLSPTVVSMDKDGGNVPFWLIKYLEAQMNLIYGLVLCLSLLIAIVYGSYQSRVIYRLKRELANLKKLRE